MKRQTLTGSQMRLGTTGGILRMDVSLDSKLMVLSVLWLDSLA